MDSLLTIPLHSTFVLPLQGAWGITDRLQWILPTAAFAYRVGDHGGVEWIPWGGLLGWSLFHTDHTVFSGRLGLGSDFRFWLTPRSSLDVGLGVSSRFITSDRVVMCTEGECPPLGSDAASSFGIVRNRMTLGYSTTIADVVTLGIAAGVSHNLLVGGDAPRGAAEHDVELSVGSVLMRGLRPQPLVRVHLGDVFSIDGYASAGYRFGTSTRTESYMLGATWTW